MNRSRASGAALVALLVAVVLLELAALAVAPVAVTARKRADEAELRFRLLAYKRAIERFRAHFGRPAAGLEELLTLPPNPRMLRALHPDPMTGAADWSIVRQPGDQSLVNVRSSSNERALDGTPYAAWGYDENFQFTVISADPAASGQPASVDAR